MENFKINKDAIEETEALLLDKDYEQLINEFLAIQSSKNTNSTVSLFLRLLYDDLIQDKNLVSKKSNSLQIQKITLTNIMNFQSNIESQVNSRKMTKEIGQELLLTVEDFLKFLFNKKLVNIFYKPLNFFTQNKSNSPKITLPLLLEFREYITQKGYTPTYIYLNSVEKFLQFASFTSGSTHDSYFWKEQIKNYEEKLQIKVIKELLAPATSYQYLKHIKVFLNFLYEEKQINFKYNIPPQMKHHGKRSNEFVHVKDLLLVINTIIENSKDVLRDLTLFLIMIETGCRSIEIVNLTMADILVKEKLITLKSKKSQQRTLQISENLIVLLVDYLKIRRNYLPHANTTSLYLTSIGTPINSKTITKIFRKYNLKAFGTIKFSAKTLRHTFITNALNNRNALEVVAEAVGHKSLKTTLYYYYRDVHAIKKLTNQINLHWREES